MGVCDEWRMSPPFLMDLHSDLGCWGGMARMCTRVLYTGKGGRVLTGRTMDWKVDLPTNLWVFPRGVSRNGGAGDRSYSWVSKYGSIVASGYDVSTTDGLNEAGLSANLLWLVESEYPPLDGDRPIISIALWAQYVLDNFATVAEAVEELAKEEFIVATSTVPGETRLATMHLSISDATGDSAIFEYIDGELVINHSPEYKVMTNSPTFTEQRAIASYWEDIGGTIMLPGTNRAADRFVRAKFYVNAVPQVEERRIALAAISSVIRNVSVPYGITTPGEPNISSTRWRTVADHKDLRYYFETTLMPGAFWAKLGNFNLDEGAPALRLDVRAQQEAGRSGEASAEFKEAEPFKFEGV